MSDVREWSFDVDRYVNQLVPPPPWHHLPAPVSWFLGHRHPNHKPAPKGNLAPIFWAFIGIFCGIVLIEAVSKHVPSFEAHSAPIIVGSFGAAAVLEFYAIESPLAQPRNAIFGQLISTIVGVSVCRLFQLHHDFESIQWLGGALACAAATALMALTKTVHPPAGATALLAVTDKGLVAMGWFLIPVMLLGCALMLVVALLVNNIGRRFPIYWWTPEELPAQRRRREQRQKDEEMAAGKGGHASSSQNGSAHEVEVPSDHELTGAVIQVVPSSPTPEVVIQPGKVCVPESMFLTQEERLLLESMSRRL